MTPVPDVPGKRVVPFTLRGRYEVLSLLSEGPGSRIYYARDSEINRNLVVKQLKSRAPEPLRAHEREAAILAGLNDPGIPRAYDRLDEGPGPSLVMDYVHGKPLARPAVRDPVEQRARCFDLVLKLLSILGRLHERATPIIHGDVKPANIIVNENHEVTLIDFGAAHVGTAAPTQVYGTRGYAPPEQASGGAPRPAWDLYASAVILHELLTNHPAQSWYGTTPPSLTQFPPELSHVLVKALDANPRNRYATARLLQAALERAMSLTTEATRCPQCKIYHPTTAHLCYHCATALKPAAKPSAAPAPQVKRVGVDRLAKALKTPTYVSEKIVDLRHLAGALSRPLGFDVLMAVEHSAVEKLPHQLKVLRRALQSHRGRTILADEVGLGKTIEAGLIREELKIRGLVNSTLILVPPHLSVQWKEEMHEKFRERFQIYDSKQPFDVLREKHVIVSLATAVRDPLRQKLLRRRWDLVIVDEAHHAKNRTSQRWRFLNQLQKNYVLLLTATPVQNNLEELHNLVSLLRPGLLSSSPSHFRLTYGVDKKRVREKDKLRKDLERVLIRTRRAEAYIRFPERKGLTHLVQPTADELELYTLVTESVKRSVSAGVNATNQLHLVHLQQRLTSSAEAVFASLQTLAATKPFASQLLPYARALLGRPFSKLLALKKIIEQVNDRVVVFTDWVPTQTMIKGWLQKQGVQSWIYGGSSHEKVRALKQFVEQGQVLIVGVSGNEGLNLQKHCHVIVNYDLPWNPMRVEQRIGRLQRIGQPRDVLVFNLALQGTIEEHVLEILRDKIHLFEISIGQLDPILGDDYVDNEDKFQDQVWKYLMQARNLTEVRRLMEEKFNVLEHAASNPEPDDALDFL